MTDYQRVKERLKISILESISQNDIFHSEEYLQYSKENVHALVMSVADYMQNVFQVSLPENALRVNVKFTEEGSSHTEGSVITVNTSTPYALAYSDPENRHAVIQGDLFHEEGHILFSDFAILSSWLNGIRVGNLPVDAQIWQEAWTLAKQEPAFKRKMVEMAKAVNNIIEDAYIETELREVFEGKGEVVRSLASSNYGIFLYASPKWDDDIPASEMYLNVLLYALVLQIAISVPPEKEAFVQELVDCAKTAMHRNPKVRIERVTKVFLKLLPVLLEEFKQPQKERTTPNNFVVPSDMSCASDTDEKDATDSDFRLANPRSLDMDVDQRSGTQKSVFTFLTMNESGIMDSSDLKLQLQPKEQCISDAPRISDAVSLSAIDQIRSKIADTQASIMAEQQRMRDLQHIADETKANISIKRDISIRSNANAQYALVKQNVQRISRQMQREIINTIKKKRIGYKLTGLPFGRRFESSALYRQDGKVFSKRKAPNETPEMIVSVLIDQSYSTKTILANELFAALVIEDMCRGLEIPILINGYYYDSGLTKTVINSFSEPSSTDGKEHLRLMGLYSKGKTPTADALQYMLCRLNEYPRKLTKLLFVITDGGSTSGAERLPGLIKQAERDKVILIAAGVGDDRKSVMEEFPNKFLEISEIEALPYRMSQIIRNQLLQ